MIATSRARHRIEVLHRLSARTTPIGVELQHGIVHHGLLLIRGKYVRESISVRFWRVMVMIPRMNNETTTISQISFEFPSIGWQNKVGI